MKKIFWTMYVVYVVMGCWLYGIPRSLSSFAAIVVIPGLALTFLYYFYDGLFKAGGRALKRKNPNQH